MSNNENRVCNRCRSIFRGGQGECICPTCLDATKRAKVRKAKVHQQQQPPENPLLQCLIQREGATTVSIGGVTYRFTPNAAGHSICHVSNPAHNKFLLKSGQYVPYGGKKL